jgi:pseudaminic acid cytidylyltransferase
MVSATAARRVAVIPARGGSQRIPRKNVKTFAGRPMITHAISTAWASGLFAEVIVSTDDEEIATLAQQAGAALPFRRPPALATHEAGTLPVIAHALQWLRDQAAEPAALCCLYPCTPLLEPQDLQRGLALLEDSGAPYAFPVLAFESPPQRALGLGADGRVLPLFPGHAATRTQDLPPAFHDAGQFYWGRPEAWAAGLSPLEHGAAFALAPDRAVDIDTPEDWARAEWLYERRLATRQDALGRQVPA